MTMNRRNVLVVLATLVIGGGVLIGTGAFSTVEAQRTVSVETAGDANAFLAIEDNSQYLTNDSNNGALALTLDGDSVDGSGFNDEANTTLTNAFTIANNGESGSIDVGFGDGQDQSTTATLDQAEVRFTLNKTSTGGTGSNGPVGVDIVVDTTADGGTAESDTITINATS